MTYKKQRNWGIFLLLIPMVVFYLWFISSIVIYIVHRFSGTEGIYKYCEYVISGCLNHEFENYGNLEQIPMDYPDLLGPTEHIINVIHGLINHILGILAILTIPALIIGIILLATNKREKTGENTTLTHEGQTQ